MAVLPGLCVAGVPAKGKGALMPRGHHFAASWTMRVFSLGWASEVHGQVVFNGQPVPGATVTATQGAKKVVVTTDAQGNYSFADLADGSWTLSVDMLCFEPVKQEIAVTVNTPAGKFELKMLPVAQLLAIATAPKVETVPALAPRAAEPAKKAAAPGTPAAAEMPKPPSEAESNDGFLVNGTTNNAATSKYALSPAFGNTRSSKSLYNGGLGLHWDNAIFDARPDSLTGLDTPKASYDRLTAVLTFGGPIHIPRLLPRGPTFFVAYEFTRNTNDTTLSGLVPTQAERAGNFAGQAITPINPATGLPYPNDTVPVSPQAQALLALYPLPNLAGSTLYNYQTAVLGATHVDAMQLRMDRNLGHHDQFYGNFAFESARNSNGSLLGFVDKTATLGMDTSISWQHRFGQRLFTTTGFKYSRLRTRGDPFFAYRNDVSGNAGITGNLQDAPDWGPPTLSFASGTAGLYDSNSEFNRNRTDGVSESVEWDRGKHNITVGGDFRRQEFNVLQQQNPRGSFTFTGALTGSDVADFLIGTPDASTVAYGNADKYLRNSAYDAFVTDDWRLRPELTLNLGIRWEYGAPITELKNRLVNIDVTSGFAGVAAVLASSPVGPLTGFHYPTSLIVPDKRGFEPRLGLSWRPIPGSTLVVRAGYGIYDDTSIYEATALQMAQQAPLSTSLNVSNGPGCALTLADGFIPCAGTTPDNFAVDPNLRVGYAQIWQISAQRDLPAALVGTLTYQGVKGTRGVQEFLPNTVAPGSTQTVTAPEGYVYKASNGDSTRESGSVQLRRRLRSGFTASVQYTYSKSIDDDAVLGGAGGVGAGVAASSAPSATIAQNWLDLKAERGLSTFDQRHLVNASLQYTSGQGLGGGTLMRGWQGTLLKEWTVVTTISAGSGLPETPVLLAAVPGTGFTGTIRPDRTGASLYSGAGLTHLSTAAYVAPAAGQWGNAGRDSIEGPDQFTMNGSLARTFRLKDGFNLDIRADGTNILNHVTYTSWNTILPYTAPGAPLVSPTFGLPAAANAMRSLEFTARLRY
jgi:hypothetical protein